MGPHKYGINARVYIDKHGKNQSKRGLTNDHKVSSSLVTTLEHRNRKEGRFCSVFTS
jgi:hypothetical protein